MNQALIISGSPGTGKTSLAKYLFDIFKIPYISLGDYAIQNNLIIEEDEERDTKVIDENGLIGSIILELEKSSSELMTIEGHYADIMPDERIKYAVLLRTNPFELEKRLQKRNYSTNKINENVQAEILSDCGSYLSEKQLDGKILEYDTSEMKIEEIANELARLLKIAENIVDHETIFKNRTPIISWLRIYGAEIDRFFLTK
jgi:adenylate kinase